MVSQSDGRSEDETRACCADRISETRREEKEKHRGTRLQQASNDPLFPAKSLDDVIDNCEMIREA